MVRGDVISNTLAKRVAGLKTALHEHPIVQSGFAWLEKELPADLYYHAPSHTGDVFSEVILFAAHDDRSEQEIELLAIAAAFHDLGFIVRPRQNEKIGASLARNLMRQSGKYDEEQLLLVEIMIHDTELKPAPEYGTLQQCASLPLSGYLLDADVSNFGRDDFISKSSLVLAEITGKGLDAVAMLETKPFMEKLLRLVEHHDWHTPAARALRQERKLDNIKRLKTLIEQS